MMASSVERARLAVSSCESTTCLYALVILDVILRELLLCTSLGHRDAGWRVEASQTFSPSANLAVSPSLPLFIHSCIAHA